MSEPPVPDPDRAQDAEAERTVAEARPGRWPGFVWAIPIAAILIVAYLGLRALANQGVDVVVTFNSAAGARAGDTKVVYKGIEVGRVTRVRLNPNAHSVDITLRLQHDLKPVITTGTKFWLIGANPSFTDLNSLKAAVAGLSIGMAPGPGEPTRHLVGLDEEPLVIPGTPGRKYLLDIDTVGAIRRGSTVLYRGFEAGKVLDVRPTKAGAFQAVVFVQAPFDDDVRTGSLFWNASAVQISLTGQGITGSLNSPSAALSGGVAFDTPKSAKDDPHAPIDARFPLYSDYGRALEGPDGPEVGYQTTFHGAAGGLGAGAPVNFAGIRIGVVNSVGVVFDPKTGAVTNPVTFGLYPQRLHMPGLAADARPDWRAASNAAVAKLLQLGYRVQIDQFPPLIGSRFVSLAKAPGAGPAALAPGAPYPVVPSASGGDVSDLYSKADSLLTKVDALPIAEIGADVRRITGRLSALLSSPQVSDSLSHLDATLRSVDQITAEVKPQVGPLVAKLNQTADQLQQTAASADKVLSGRGAAPGADLPEAIHELTNAARSIRSLADYLSRHPDALIRGKTADHN